MRRDARPVLLGFLGGFLALALLGVWDKMRPLGSEPPALIDDRLQENFAALEAAIDLEHDFTTGGSQTGRHALGRGTTAQRAAAYPTPAEGNVWANTETDCWEVYNGTDGRWDSFGCGSVGDLKITAYDPSSPPTGWLPCDGQAIDSTVYAALFAAICPGGLGTCPYDTQDGAGAPGGSLFRVPKFDKHVFAGIDSTGAAADYNAIGEDHGKQTPAAVTGAEIEEFAATVTETLAGAFSVNENPFGPTGIAGSVFHVSNTSTGVGPEPTAADHTHSVSVDVGTAGASGFEHRDKFVVVGCLIRALP